MVEISNVLHCSFLHSLTRFKKLKICLSSCVSQITLFRIWPWPHVTSVCRLATPLLKMSHCQFLTFLLGSHHHLYKLQCKNYIFLSNRQQISTLLHNWLLVNINYFLKTDHRWQELINSLDINTKISEF